MGRVRLFTFLLDQSHPRAWAEVEQTLGVFKVIGTGYVAVVDAYITAVVGLNVLGAGQEEADDLVWSYWQPEERQ